MKTESIIIDEQKEKICLLIREIGINRNFWLKDKDDSDHACMFSTYKDGYFVYSLTRRSIKNFGQTNTDEEIEKYLMEILLYDIKNKKHFNNKVIEIRIYSNDNLWQDGAYWKSDEVAKKQQESVYILDFKNNEIVNIPQNVIFNELKNRQSAVPYYLSTYY